MVGQKMKGHKRRHDEFDSSYRHDDFDPSYRHDEYDTSYRQDEYDPSYRHDEFDPLKFVFLSVSFCICVLCMLNCKWITIYILLPIVHVHTYTDVLLSTFVCLFESYVLSLPK